MPLIFKNLGSCNRVSYFYGSQIFWFDTFRHPCILPILEPLVEDKTSLAMATKRVTKSLAGYLSSLPQRKENLFFKV